MNLARDWMILHALFFILLIAEGAFGRPQPRTNRKDSKIVKRVEISGVGKLERSEVASRRQNVIHAGQDYDSDEDRKKPEEDELENIGKVVDYDGKVIETRKPGKSKWKDTAAISKDVIERIKEIQDSLMKRSGGKNLQEKLELLQPEKNITVDASADSSGVTSRKVIPEDVVNKIIQKFQELRSQAKELAKLDQRAKAEEKEKEVEDDGRKEIKGSDEKGSEKPKIESKSRKVDEGTKKPSRLLSPYESIGPAKDNEEVKNITQHSVSETTANLPGSQEVFKSSSSGAIVEQPNQQQNFMQDAMHNGNAMFQQQNMKMMQQSMPPSIMNSMPQNVPNSMMMMGGKVPMMFIKSGEMLVPVFSGQNGPMYGNPNMNMNEDRKGAEGQQSAPFMPMAQKMMQPSYVPQQPMMETGQSRSGPPSTNMGSANGVQIPSVPYSLIMSLMSGPGMAPNFPAAQPQMNPASLNMPQMSTPMQNNPFGDMGLTGGEMAGLTRRFEPTSEGMSQLMNQQGANGASPSTESEQTPAFFGGGPSPNPQMGNPGGIGPVGVSMDLSGRLSLLKSTSSSFMQQPPSMGPANPFQNMQPGMELVNREKQMLSPTMVNPVNDLSDPMEAPTPSSLHNVSPDQLLELAKMRSTETENPEIGDVRSLPRDPDTLLDTLHSRQLNRGLVGPGDPERIGMPANPMGHSPFDNTNPETLLDMLSKRKSNEMGNKDVLDWERRQQNQLFNNFQSESQAFGRGQITPIGTNGMQSVTSLPKPGSIDPSFADVIGNQPFDIANRNSATDNPIESSLFQPGRDHYRVGPSSISVMSHDDLRYENSRHAIDTGDQSSPINQADVYVRHKIMSPSLMGEKRSKTPSLHDDNIELKVNGKALAETASLRSKIVDGKIQQGHGKVLTSKSPVRIELSHSNDAKKTKIVNIVTTGKYDVKESRRDKISKKGSKNIINRFYKMR